MEVFEIKVNDLLKKGIRPCDIAKILEVPRNSITKYINEKKKEEQKIKTEDTIINIIMNNSGISETSARTILEKLKSKGVIK